MVDVPEKWMSLGGNELVKMTEVERLRHLVKLCRSDITMEVALLFAHTVMSADRVAATHEAAADARKAGVIEGMRRFAWWKDGVEQVGTCGTTLKQAIANFEMEASDDNS